MRLQQFIASGGVAGPSGGYVDTSAPYGTELATLGQNVQQTALRTLDIVSRANLAKQKLQQATDASQAMLDATTALDDADQKLRLGYEDPDTGETVPPAAHGDYLRQYRQAAEKSLSTTVGSITDPETQMAARQLILRHMEPRYAKALAYDNGLFLNGQRQSVLDQIESFGQSAATNSPEEQMRVDALAQGLIRSQRGVFTPEQQDALEKGYFSRTQEVQARKLAQTDPALAVERLQMGQYRIPPERADAIATSIHAAERQKEADATRLETQAEVDGTRRYHDTLSDLNVRAAHGDLTLNEVDAAQSYWRRRMTPADYNALREKILNPKEERSDPLVRVDVIADSNQPSPRYTVSQLKNLVVQGALSSTDFQTALNTRNARQTHQESIRTQERGLNQAEANRQTAQLTRDQAQAEQMFHAAVGINPATWERLEPTTKVLYSQGLQTITNRSAAFPALGGKENPLKVVEEIIPQYVKLIGDQAQLEEDKIRGFLGKYQTPAQLDADRRAGVVGDAEFRRLTGLFDQLKDATDRKAKLAAEQAARGEKMGRKK